MSVYGSLPRLACPLGHSAAKIRRYIVAGMRIKHQAQRTEAVGSGHGNLSPLLSIVVPALNEQDNVAELVEQVRTAVIQPTVAHIDPIDAELIVVDDGSNDATLQRLTRMTDQHDWLRVLHRRHSMGQSAAMFAGIHAARGQWIAMLDADLQNDPADLPGMLKIVLDGLADVVQGDRTANRRDKATRRFASWIGRSTRRLILGDTIRDTGCTARVLRADIAKQLPLQFKGMHRFIPYYAQMIGARVIESPVHHRPRFAGDTKYGAFTRGVAGLFDCFAVRWMGNRYRDSTAKMRKPLDSE